MALTWRWIYCFFVPSESATTDQNISALNTISPCWKTTYMHWHIPLQKTWLCFAVSLTASSLENKERQSVLDTGVHCEISFRNTTEVVREQTWTNNTRDKKSSIKSAGETTERCLLTQSERGLPAEPNCLLSAAVWWHSHITAPQIDGQEKKAKDIKT